MKKFRYLEIFTKNKKDLKQSMELNWTIHVAMATGPLILAGNVNMTIDQPAPEKMNVFIIGF